MNEAIIGLIGVIVGATITVGKDFIFSYLYRKREAQYLAIRLVSILDEFIEGCVNVANDDGLYRGEYDSNGCSSIQVITPNFDIHHLDADWKSLPSILMYEILSFPNLVNAANHQISGKFEYGDGPPDYEDGFEERQYQYSSLGIEAASLAEKLRDRYKIPPKAVDGWNPVNYMFEQKNRIETIRNRQRKEHQQLMDKLSS